ncbi:MAG: TrbI/VirB10 family protein [Endomicrobium sp.]|jgi:type IV secretory pathway VirB10-like protein|nr:TrbI/VirB10 family protein [Endomicrobium sp.]
MKKILFMPSVFILFLFSIFVPPALGAENVYPTKIIPVKTNYFLHTGFSFEAVLKTAIFSFNTITPVIAETEYDVLFNGKIMIPRGTKLIGACSIEKSVDRVNISFNTMVFPNGQEIPMSAIALHVDGSGGIPGKVTKQKAKIPTQILLSAAATGSSLAVGDGVGAEMIKGIANDTKSEVAQKQDYSIEVKKNVAIQVFINQRMEY